MNWHRSRSNAGPTFQGANQRGENVDLYGPVPLLVLLGLLGAVVEVLEHLEPVLHRDVGKGDAEQGDGRVDHAHAEWQWTWSGVVLETCFYSKRERRLTRAMTHRRMAFCITVYRHQADRTNTKKWDRSAFDDSHQPIESKTSKKL